MPHLDINDVRIAYEIVGSGPRSAVITPGGRFPKESPGVRELASVLAEQGYRVLIWDRPNCGESDVCFEAETESVLNADTLAALLDRLGMAPALVIGVSAGSRVSLMTASRHPQAVRSLALLWITGGWTGLAGLAGVYCGELLTAAKIGGMEAVCESQWIAETVRRNPRSRGIILSYDVDRFCDIMQRWARAFIPDEGSPVPGMSLGDFKKVKAPVLIFRSGHSDFSHPDYTTDETHRLIDVSELVAPPWGDREWIERVQDSARGLFRRVPLLAPQIIAFENATLGGK